MRDKFLIAVFLSLFLGNFFIVRSQSEPGFSNFFGKVSAIDAEKGEITIVTAENSSFVVNTKNVDDLKQVPAGETTLHNATAITFSQILVDDQALIRGKLLDKNTIDAKQIIIITKIDLEKRKSQKRDDWKLRGISATVIKTDPPKRKISVQIKGQSQSIDIFILDGVVVQRYRTNAVNLNDFEPSTIEKIKEGDQVRALGNKSSDGLQFDAEEIFVGVFNTNIGKVVSTDPQNNELKIVDANNKKISVIVNQESNIRRLTQNSVGSGDTRPNEADGRINLTKLLEKLPRVAISDIKVGETIAVTSSSDLGAEKVVGLVLVTGINVLKEQSSKKSSNTPKRNFNLDVF